MDELTINLARFALNVQTLRQQVASKNIANVASGERVTTDFSQYLNQIEALSRQDKIAYLQALNNSGVAGLESAVQQVGGSTGLEQEHSNSTKAMLEYQALIEALSRKMSIMGTVFGGR